MPLTSSDDRANVGHASLGARLDGWKVIASYLGKAERTVKRWERERGLPVHRVPGGARASVYARPAELEQWLELSQNSIVGSEEMATNSDPITEEASFWTEAEEGPPAALSEKRSWLTWVASLLLVVVALLGAVLRYSRGAARRPEAHETASPVKPSSPAGDVRELYLKGRYEWSQRTPDSLNRALEDFTQAIAKEPKYAEAYAALADTYDLLPQYTTMPERDAYARAIVAARKALGLDDSLAEAHRALAFAEMYGEWDFADSEKEFRRAIELNPNDPVARMWYANAFAVPGRFAESLEQMNKAQELDPSSHSILADKGWMLFNSGKRQEGIELLKEVERSAPEFRSSHVYLMLINLDLRDYPAYLAEGEKTAESMNDPVLQDIIASARIGYGRGGQEGMFRNLYVKQKEYYDKGMLVGTTLAKTCVQMGKKQEALHLLEEAYVRHETDVLACLAHPDLLTLKDEPRYRALLNKIGFPSNPQAFPATASVAHSGQLRDLSSIRLEWPSP
jgi:tetratricopeptide (TPR) repeat protein